MSLRPPRCEMQQLLRNRSTRVATGAREQKAKWLRGFFAPLCLARSTSSSQSSASGFDINFVCLLRIFPEPREHTPRFPLERGWLCQGSRNQPEELQGADIGSSPSCFRWRAPAEAAPESIAFFESTHRIRRKALWRLRSQRHEVLR